MINTATSIFNFMCTYRDSNESAALSQDIRQYSFNNLREKVLSLASRLSAEGIKKGDIIASPLPNIIQNVILVYAAGLVGATVFEMHPKIGDEHFKKELLITKPKLVFLSEVNYTRLKKYCNNAKIIYCPYGAYGYIGLSEKDKKFKEYKCTGEETAIIMHSGGTSGEAKLVSISHKALNSLASNLLSSLHNKFTEDYTMLAAIPMFHGFGLGVGIHCGLCAKMNVVLLPKFSTKRVIYCINNKGANVIIAIPRMLEKLIKEKNINNAAKKIKEIYVGGDKIDQSLVDKIDAILNKVGSSARVSAGYGLSETCSVCSLQRDEYVSNSIGKTLNSVEAIIVDDNNNILDNGEIGELLLCSNQTMDGYVTIDGIDRSSFVEINGKEYLRTGDMFKMDENGYLFFSGRKKRLIKISGINVFPSQIEELIVYNGYAPECVAFSFLDNGKPKIVLQTEIELSESIKEEIKKNIKKELSHWSVPSVFHVSPIPRTELGKIDFIKAKELFHK